MSLLNIESLRSELLCLLIGRITQKQISNQFELLVLIWIKGRFRDLISQGKLLIYRRYTATKSSTRVE